MMKKTSLLISCEHASAAVPQKYAALFKNDPRVLETHRAYDLGALQIAQSFQKQFKAPLYKGKVTRLLVDLNRSRTNKKSLHSEFSKCLPDSERSLIQTRFYDPYRKDVLRALQGMIDKHGSVFHLSVHSFTPVLRGRTRNADVGFLFDPSFPAEKKAAQQWKSSLKKAAPELRVRFNYPYRGTMDGFTTYLRHHFNRSQYVSLEVEINQRFYLEGPQAIAKITDTLLGTVPKGNCPQGGQG